LFSIRTSNLLYSKSLFKIVFIVSTSKPSSKRAKAILCFSFISSFLLWYFCKTFVKRAELLSFILKKSISWFFELFNFIFSCNIYS
jgi:hypothetical protein